MFIYSRYSPVWKLRLLLTHSGTEVPWSGAVDAIRKQHWNVFHLLCKIIYFCLCDLKSAWYLWVQLGQQGSEVEPTTWMSAVWLGNVWEMHLARPGQKLEKQNTLSFWWRIVESERKLSPSSGRNRVNMEIASCCQSIRLKIICEKKYFLAYFPSRKTAICIVLKHFEEQKADRLVCGHFIVVIEWLTGWVNTQQYLLDYRIIM